MNELFVKKHKNVWWNENMFVPLWRETISAVIGLANFG
jgi:hypothetical protein